MLSNPVSILFFVVFVLFTFQNIEKSFSKVKKEGFEVEKNKIFIIMVLVNALFLFVVLFFQLGLKGLVVSSFLPLIIFLFIFRLIKKFIASKYEIKNIRDIGVGIFLKIAIIYVIGCFVIVLFYDALHVLNSCDSDVILKFMF